MSKVPNHRNIVWKKRIPTNRINEITSSANGNGNEACSAQNVNHRENIIQSRESNSHIVSRHFTNEVEVLSCADESDINKPNIYKNDFGETSVQNSRILDLRKKLDEINKKNELLDEKERILFSSNTHTVQQDETSDSGPYSLLFDLKMSKETVVSSHCWLEEKCESKSEISNIINDTSSTVIKADSTKLNFLPRDRKPNIINLEEINATEFEYTCNNSSSTISDKPTRSSRSDLSLHLTNTTRNSKIELSPLTDTSIHRRNDEHSLDDSLGILTPDQMDDMFSPTVEELPVFGHEIKDSPESGETPSTEKTDTNSPVSTMYLEHDIETEQQLSKVPLGRSMTSTPMKNTDVESEKNTAVENITNNIVCIDTTMVSLEECDLQFGETDGTEFLVRKLSDDTNDKMCVPNTDDEFLQSVHSSILEPASSTMNNTMNLDLPFDCKNMKNHCTERIEQTPSPEDLPLDVTDVHEEGLISNSHTSQAPLMDSQTLSDIKTDLVKSMETSKVSNSFITSITSITSLDGYQGDGEMSRPVSRGGYPSGNKDDPIEINWQNVPVNRRQDPMTDSDFFTESDADGHDDHVQRGDRRAQVIDGALYGGSNHDVPLIVNRNDDSCMDSSGIYTDLETRRSSPVFLNAIEDMSPDGSSPSTHSECSQKNIYSKSFKATSDNRSIVSRASLARNANILEDQISMHKRVVELKPDKMKEEKKCFSLKKYKMPKRDVPSKLKTMLSRKPDSDTSSENSPSNKMKKMERREVTSRKLNVDAKMKTFKDVKSKVDCCFPLQKSQTACSVSRMLSAKASTALKPKTRHGRARVSEAPGLSGKSSMHSSHSDVSGLASPPAKLSAPFPASRTTKKRDSTAPLVGAGVGVTSPRSPASAHTPAQPPSHVSGRKSGNAATHTVAALPKLSGSPVSARSRIVPAPASPATPAVPAAPTSPRKPAQRRLPSAARPTTLPSNVKEPVRGGSARSGKRAPAASASAAPPSAPAAPPPGEVRAAPPAGPALAHAAKGVEALAVLVQYLVCQLETLKGEGWRAEAVRWRGVAAAERGAAARAAQLHQQRSQKDLDTIGECLSKISQLEMELSRQEEERARLVAAGRRAEEQYGAALRDLAALSSDINNLKSTVASLKDSVRESGTRACAGAERERELAAQLEAARRDLEHAHIARHPDMDKEKSDLVAEVRSLRAVLELKQAEASALRATRRSLSAEREARAAAERELAALRQAGEELRERAVARQRDADALRDENRRLREAAVRDQQAHARLTLYNEELRYKLRQKSQVVSLLAGGSGGCVPGRARAASCDSPPPDSPSPSASPSPPEPASPGACRSPAVKGVVEKHDSVSWVLEIEESAEEVAERIARRSNSFRSPGGGGGVKRRGGGSPGSPRSPQPASPAPNASKLFRCGDRDPDLSAPPLKESAGEAIYIYDNRQF